MPLTLSNSASLNHFLNFWIIEIFFENLFVLEKKKFFILKSAVIFFLTVQFLILSAVPEFVISPTSKMIGLGRTLSLQCVVDGSPVPALYWRQGTDQVSD